MRQAQYCLKKRNAEKHTVLQSQPKGAQEDDDKCQLGWSGRRATKRWWIDARVMWRFLWGVKRTIYHVLAEGRTRLSV